MPRIANNVLKRQSFNCTLKYRCNSVRHANRFCAILVPARDKRREKKSHISAYLRFILLNRQQSCKWTDPEKVCTCQGVVDSCQLNQAQTWTPGITAWRDRGCNSDTPVYMLCRNADRALFKSATAFRIIISKICYQGRLKFKWKTSRCSCRRFSCWNLLD